MHNLYEQFRQLIPDPPLQVGTVVGVGAGSVTRLGIVRSTQVEAAMPEVWQTLGVQSHA